MSDFSFLDDQDDKGAVRINVGQSRRRAVQQPKKKSDRSAAAGKLVVFTGEPLDRTLTITGAVHVEIEIASTHGDIAVIAYLEAVRPDGYVHYITEGALRALHRRRS